jgi:hypothetical protein
MAPDVVSSRAARTHNTLFPPPPVFVSSCDRLAAALAKTPEPERAEVELILPYLAAQKGDDRDIYAAVVRRLIAGLASELR